mgnify:CR=1 FL=1
MAAYYALLDPGDTLMGLSLVHGGHMTHGLKLKFSSTFYNAVQYHVGKDGYIDIDEMYKLAKEHKPKLIVAGGSAYARVYEWAKYKEVADSVGAYLVADMSHVAGLVAGGVYPNPVGIADIVTTTTHKTLRGPRGAMIMCKQQFAAQIDKAVFPGVQGGPHDHINAAKAVAYGEALKPEFQTYSAQVIKNAQALASALQNKGYRIISGGTDNHLLLVDLFGSKQITGKDAEKTLENVGISINKNMIPFDPRKPLDPSGVRLGTPALTTRGCRENDMQTVADLIDESLMNRNNENKLKILKEKVKEFSLKFPVLAIE